MIVLNTLISKNVYWPEIQNPLTTNIAFFFFFFFFQLVSSSYYMLYKLANHKP